jgi:2,4-dienoyl-CoA reductase-like NADH-dependent reductase (Old Yellow Enzyme family)
MTLLFEPVSLGRLSLRNRLMRSATAERMAHPESGAPLPSLRELYRQLGEGGVGLIVTGHVYVDRGGRAHPEMAAFDRDDLIPEWRRTIAPAQESGARVVAQINHSGANCDPAVTPHALSPSGVTMVHRGPSAKRATDRTPDEGAHHAAAMTESELLAIADSYGDTARRAREAGFDGVQIHGAHGYLVSQFLTPATNQRNDEWGGTTQKRTAFLRRVILSVRAQVGPDYPVWIKLGVAGSDESGQTLDEGVQAALACVEEGVDAIELSHGWGSPPWTKDEPEPPFLRMAEAVRAAVGPDYPLALVNGFRNIDVMQRVLESGAADLISLCRPLIVQPDLPRMLQAGETGKAICASCSTCWPNAFGEGVACHNRSVQRRLAEAAV